MKRAKTLLLIILCLAFVMPLFAVKKDIAGNIFLFKHKGYVLKEKTSKTSILAFKTPVKIKGTINHSLLSVGNCVIVSGKVNKNILVIKGNIRIKDTAEVKGTIMSLGGKVVVEGGASAKCLRLEVFHQKLKFSPGFKIFLVYLSFIILGFFFNFFFMPNFLFLGEYLKRKFATSLLIGLLAVPLMGILSTVLIGTVIGTLFLPALIFIYIFYFFFSFYAVATMVGEKFLKLFTFQDHPYFEQFLGISIFFFVSLIPVIGFFLFGLFMLAGLGSVIKLKFGVR